MNRTVDWAQELPKDGGGGVAENCAVAASEYRSHKAPMETQASVTYGVDALVDAVEVAFAKALGDCVLADANLTELPRDHDTVLVRGNSREARPRGVAFFPHGWE